MAREQETQYEQDRFGNERRKLDTLRAREGFEGLDTQEGISDITSLDTSTGVDDTGNIQIAYSLPTRADRVILDEAHAYNGDSIDATYSLYELDLDSNGNITGQTRRSVPVQVSSQSTRVVSLHGKPYESAIGVASEFEGKIAVGVIVDHDQSTEESIVQTE